jgi:hypothetical protein
MKALNVMDLTKSELVSIEGGFKLKLNIEIES